MKYLLLSIIAVLLLSPIALAEKELLIIGASWCKPCSQLRNFIKNSADKIPAKYKKIEYLDIDKFSDVAKQLGVKSVPSSFIYEDSVIKSKKVGFSQKDYENWLEKN